MPSVAASGADQTARAVGPKEQRSLLRKSRSGLLLKRRLQRKRPPSANPAEPPNPLLSYRHSWIARLAGQCQSASCPQLLFEPFGVFGGDCNVTGSHRRLRRRQNIATEALQLIAQPVTKSQDMLLDRTYSNPFQRSEARIEQVETDKA